MDPSPTRKEGQSSLCDSCRNLELASVLEGLKDAEIPKYGKPLLSLGRRPTNISNVTCDLCRFFFGMSTEYRRRYRQHVRLFDRLTHHDSLPFDQSIPSLFLSVVRENSRLDYDWRIRREIIQTGISVYRPTTTALTQIVRDVDPNAINYKLLVNFLSDCNNDHVQCNQVGTQSNSLPYIKLLDCQEQKLVISGMRDQRYCCLSYVWGNHSRGSDSLYQEAMTGKILIANLPLTIQDSIQVVLNMGLRYLWVDRYCVNQEDSVEKTLMLRNMDQIYENAELTIVNLYGENDQAGLPGVSCVTRMIQPRYDISSGSLIFSCPAISRIIADSKWATRGWTYQEVRLSRRCLFFTHHQVYFVCQDSTRSEAVPMSHGGPWVVEALNSDSLSDVVTIFGGDDSLMNPLLDDILVFSQRKLTYQSDILDAFRGILARSGFITFWGVPITAIDAITDPSKGLALGMTWSRRPDWLKGKHLAVKEKVPYTRCLGFPTWSWASVAGEICVIGADEVAKLVNSFKGIENVANIEFFARSGDSWVSLAEYIPMQPSNILPETLESRELLVEGDILQVRLSNDASQFSVLGINQAGGSTHHAYIDVDSEREESLRRSMDAHGIEEALVLVLREYPKSPPGKRGRMVLILLRWIADGRAERRGLLSSHVESWDFDLLRSMQTTRKRFILR